MSNQRIKVPRASDKQVAKVFKDLGAEFGVAVATVQALGFSAIGNVQIAAEPEGEWQVLLKHNSYLIERLSLQVADISVAYFRGGNYTPEQKSPFFDEIVLTQKQNQQGSKTSNEDKLNLVAFLVKRFSAVDSKRTIKSGITDEQSELLAIHQSTLERLEHLNEDLIRQGAQFRENLQAQFDEKSRKADEKLENLEEELSQRYSEKEEALKESKRLLDEKFQAIDDRDNTHARRQIRDSMLEEVRERVSQFGVSDKTEKKRRPVLIGIAVLTVLLVALLFWTGYEITSLDKQYFSKLESIRNISAWGLDELKKAGVTPETVAKVSAVDVDRSYLYWLWARFALLSIGLFGTVLYYIRWQNKWAEQHSSSEFQLRQFQIDISRANWVVESCLEWRKETDSAIPAELIGSITRNLFADPVTDSNPVIHPADELASALVGSASKLNLKVGDSELTFNKPGKIAKTVKSSNQSQKNA